MEEKRWANMELALVLGEATGKRLGSIRHLRWEDIDFSCRAILWRAELDNEGKEWVVQMPDSLAEELKQFRMRFGAITGWIFAGERRFDFFFQAEDGIRYYKVTGVQTCALPI